MEKNSSDDSNEPLSLSKSIEELASADFSEVLAAAKRRRDAALKAAQHNLLKGAVEHDKEIRQDPNVDPDARADSLHGVQGDEADMLAADPTAHDFDPPEES